MTIRLMLVCNQPLQTQTEKWEEWAEAILKETDIPVESKVVYPYQQAYFSEVANQQVRFLTEKESWMDFSNQVGVGYILDKATYEKMTSQKLELASDQVAFIVRSPVSSWSNPHL